MRSAGEGAKGAIGSGSIVLPGEDVVSAFAPTGLGQFAPFERR